MLLVSLLFTTVDFIAVIIDKIILLAPISFFNDYMVILLLLLFVWIIII